MNTTSKLRILGLAILPFIIMAGFLLASSVNESASTAKQAVSPPVKSKSKFTTVVIIIDSLSEQVARRGEIMPNLQRLASRGVSGAQRSCVANLTAPCLATALEGRQSPFLAAVNNFSARASTRPNYFSMLQGGGWKSAVISDHTLSKKYSGSYAEGISYDALFVPFRKRDEFAFKKTFSLLDQKRFDVIVVHIVGTDSIAHRQRPDHPEYARVFGQTDAFVGEIAARLDLSRDSLVVFGDHGHGKGGHHTRQTWYVAAGPGFAQGTVPLDQPSLLFLLSGIHRLALPLTYEGALAWDVFRRDTLWLQRWQSTIAQGWQSASSYASTKQLDQVLERMHKMRDDQPFQHFVQYIPWWMHLVMVGAAMMTLGVGPARLSAGYVWFQFSWLAVAIASGWGGAVWVALVPQLWLSRSGVKNIPILLILSALAGISGILIPWVFDTFHTRADFSFGMPVQIWFASFVIVPMLVGAYWKPFGQEQRISQAVLFILISAAFLAAPGIYYYSAAQMIHVLFFPSALLVLFLEIALNQRRQWPLLILFMAAMPFMNVSAGAWNWHYILHIRMNEFGPAGPIFVGVSALLICGVLWRDRNRFLTAAAIILLILDGWALSQYFGFDLTRVAGFGLLLVSLSAAMKILGGQSGIGQPASSTAWQVMFLVGFTFIALWSSLDGFFLKNLRFQFALEQFKDVFHTEATLAAAVTTLVALKYLLVVAPVVIAAALSLGSQRLISIAPWAILAIAAKVLMQSVQTVGVGFVEVFKASELLIQEMVGNSFMALSLWICLMGLALGLSVRDRYLISAMTANRIRRRHDPDDNSYTGH